MDSPAFSCMIWRFVRVYLMWMIIGVVLVIVIYAGVSIGVPYLREQRIARKIELLGGRPTLQYCGPEWLKKQFQAKPGPFHRIVSVTFNDRPIQDDDLVIVEPLVHLTGLYLGNCEISGKGLQHVRRLTNLERLHLEGTRITDEDLDYLKELTNLEDLRMQRTRISDAGLSRLRHLINLDVLDVRVTAVTNEGLKHLQGFKSLRVLNIGQTRITDAGLEQLSGLTKIEMLDLTDSAISDAGLVCLCGLNRLRDLRLPGCKTTIEGRESLQTVLPRCEITPKPLYLRRSQFR